ncbi:MAG TPA: laccase domain-containing protein, partial [Acidimicrobiales bacterium]
FGDEALAPIEARFGAQVRSTTTWRTPALDLPAVVAAALQEVGVESIADESGCTACDLRWFSHRARGDVERFATLAWIEP